MLTPMVADSNSNQRTVIQASEILAKIERGEDVEYDGVIVKGDLDISGLDLLKVISSKIIITNSEIQGEVNFQNAHLQKKIAFEEVVFGEDVYFEGAKFDGHDDFFWEEFGRYASSFQRAVFGRSAYFQGAELSGYANFVGAKFLGGDADFTRVKFSGNVRFEEVVFGEDAYFLRANFSGYANFLGAEFDGDVYFEGAKFGGNVHFQRTKFCEGVYFEDTKFSLPVFQEMTCRIAKRKMEEVGNKKEADDYFYREMEAIRIKNGIKGTEKLVWPWNIQISGPYSKSKEWLKLVGSKIWRLGWYDFFEYLVIQVIFGYGVHPIRLFGFWILMAVAFASFYWYFDAVEGARTSVDYIWFSIATSATPGYALYNPIGNYKIVTGIQAIIGTFMWAAFIATFARKWQR